MMDEFKDLTGILDRLAALQGAIMLKGSAAWMSVGVSRWDVEIIEHASLFDKLLRDVDRSG